MYDNTQATDDATAERYEVEYTALVNGERVRDTVRFSDTTTNQEVARLYAGHHLHNQHVSDHPEREVELTSVEITDASGSSNDDSDNNGETEIMEATNQAYDVAGHTVEVHGIGSDDKHGAYPVSGDPYGEHVVVVVDGDEHRVPVTSVRKTAFDSWDNAGVFARFDGDVIDFDVVYADGDELHAEGRHNGAIVELYADDMARDPWAIATFEDGGEGESVRESVEPLGTVIWEREDTGDSGEGNDSDGNSGNNDGEN
jgi:hypothetical protein